MFFNSFTMFWSKFVNFTLPFSNFVCSRTFVSLINNRWRKRRYRFLRNTRILAIP